MIVKIKPSPSEKKESLISGEGGTGFEIYAKYQYIGWMVSFTIFFAFYIYYLHLASPLVPYMDSVRYIGQVHDLLTGTASLSEIWHQLGSVGIMYPLITLFEWIFWGLDTRLTVYFTAAVWAILYSIYIKMWPNFYNEYASSELDNRRLLSIFAFQLLVGFYFFSPASWETELLDLGFAQNLKNLIIAVYLCFLSNIDYQACTTRKLLGFGILGGVIILFVTYGWSYPFSVTVTFLVALCKGLGSTNRNRGLYVVLPVLVAQVIYIKESAGIVLNSMAVSHDIGGAIDFIIALTYGAASIFVGVETLNVLNIPLIIVMLIGVLFLLALSVVFILWFKSGLNDRKGCFFAALIVFGLCTLTVISIARGGQGYQFAAASRYFMDYQFIFIGFLGVTTCLFSLPPSVCAMNLAGFRVNSKISAIYFVLIFGGIAIVGHAATYYDEYKKAPYRAAVYKAQSFVYLSGEINETNSALLQTNIVSLTKAIPIVDQYKLASLRDFSGKCDLNNALISDTGHKMESTGRWIGRNTGIILGACSQVFVVEGFLPKSFSKRTLTLIVNGEIFKKVIEPEKRFVIPINQKMLHNIVRLNFIVDYTQSTSELNSLDIRELGIFITKIGI